MIARLKLLENLANENHGPLFLYVPEEEEKVFEQLIEVYKIRTVILSTASYAN